MVFNFITFPANSSVAPMSCRCTNKCSGPYVSPVILRFTLNFQVPRNRLLPLPNHQTLHPASLAAQQTTPHPLAHPSPSAPQPDPRPATPPPPLPLPPHSRLPPRGATPTISLRSRLQTTHLQSLHHWPAPQRSLLLSARPSGTSRAWSLHLQAPRPHRTPLLHPLTPARRWQLLRLHLPISRAHSPDRGRSPSLGTDPPCPHPLNPTLAARPTGSAPLPTKRWVGAAP